jgi:hypothetical protein
MSLTKNGYGVMIILSLEAYSRQFDDTEKKLDEADSAAQASPVRKSHAQVFRATRKRTMEWQDIRYLPLFEKYIV